MPLILILAETGLELIPDQIRNHPSVTKNLKVSDYSTQLLDNALHHSAMINLSNYEKRGRPDIAHNCLLNALGSPLNKEGHLKIFLHTVNNKIFKFNPEIRLSRNYKRFKGLMAKLLVSNEININSVKLISLFSGDLKDLIKKFKNRELILLSSKGKLIKYHLDLFPKSLTKNIIIIIGGFQKGNFAQDILKLSEKIISISQYSLNAWNVVNKIITFYEIAHNIL